MNNISGKKLRVIGGIAIAGAIGVAAATMLGSAAPAGAAPGGLKNPGLAAAINHKADAGSFAAGQAEVSHKADAGSFDVGNVQKTVINLSLQAMPHGHVDIGSGGASIDVFGLTPGSTHEMALSAAGLTFDVGSLVADAGGVATDSFPMSSLSSAFAGSGLAKGIAQAWLPGIRLEILNAGPGTPAIARTAQVSGSSGYYQLTGVEPGGYGPLQGTATVVYQPQAQKLSVTVNASGLTPGAHAAHIHAGSCQQQGPVAHMLQDFTADRHGVIDNETRTVLGVTAPQLHGGWYLNLHQGNSNNILDGNGNPTIFFRPVLCANI